MNYKHASNYMFFKNCLDLGAGSSTITLLLAGPLSPKLMKNKTSEEGAGDCCFCPSTPPLPLLERVCMRKY